METSKPNKMPATDESTADDPTADTASSEPSVSADPPSTEGTLRLGVAANGDLRWALVDITGPVEDVRRRLDLSPLASVALGRSLAAAALLFRFTTKSPGRLLFEVRGEGPLGKVVAEIDERGDLRGLVGNPKLETPASGSLDLGPAVGPGLLRVVREDVSREDGSKRYSSQTALVDGEIGTDLVHFLEQSQQIRSAALLGVLPGPQGIVAAGGLLVEAFPGVPEEVLMGLESNIGTLGGEISPLLASRGADGLLDILFDGFDRQQLERHALRYRCGCSAEKLRASLESLSSEDLLSVTDDSGHCRAQCAFCGSEYVFNSQELMSH